MPLNVFTAPAQKLQEQLKTLEESLTAILN